MTTKKSSINNIRVFEVKGPWLTKSNGSLELLSALDYSEMSSFFNYDPKELSKIDHDIRGLRIYRVSDLKKGAIGASEWHRVRTELIIVTKGSVRWHLVDSQGEEKNIILTPNNSVITIPPFTMHTYTSLENDSEILVFTNTLFKPEDPSTHDTYPTDTFPPI